MQPNFDTSFNPDTGEGVWPPTPTADCGFCEYAEALSNCPLLDYIEIPQNIVDDKEQWDGTALPKCLEPLGRLEDDLANVIGDALEERTKLSSRDLKACQALCVLYRALVEYMRTASNLQKKPDNAALFRKVGILEGRFFGHFSEFSFAVALAKDGG